MRVVARRQPGADGSLGFAHEVEIEGGHTVLADEPISEGGNDAAPSPTQLLAASLAACTAITIEMYGERKGWDLGPVEVDVDLAYEGPVPASFEVTLRLPADLDEEQRERLLAIAAKCPVHKALGNETEVTVCPRIEAL